MDQTNPSLGIRVIDHLEQIGCSVIFNANQTGTGEEFYRAGLHADARDIAEKFLKDFDSELPLIVPSVQTAHYIKDQMPDLFANSSLHLKCKSLADHTVELSEFLVRELKMINFNKTIEKRILLHHSCGYDQLNSPNNLNALFKKVKGVEILHQEYSCGWQERLYLDKKVGRKMGDVLSFMASEKDVDIIVVDESYCALNLIQSVQEHELDIEVKYFAELLFE